jgi:uncharacterized protein (UPF0276 family)
MGLRSVHYDHVLKHRPKVDFFEVISETFLDKGGKPMAVLEEVSSHYRVLLHGVSMAVGNTDPIDFEYLAKLKKLAQKLKAPFVSDHLCWNAYMCHNSHDLLPIPLTEETLKHVVSRVRQIQDFLELPVALENPSNYLEFKMSQMSEIEYLARLAEDADCGLLMDVNNVFVSANNHGFDPDEYIEQVPVERVLYHHVAGHTDKGTHIVDTHSDHVVDKVWEMYTRLHERHGGRSTMVEWDADIPDFETVHQEVLKAQYYRDLAEARQDRSSRVKS